MLVAGFSLIIMYFIFKLKLSKRLIIIPILLNILVIAVVVTGKVGLFGLLGIFGLVPICIKLKKQNHKI